jgi:hypothetical protein
MLPTKFWFIWPNGFRGEESKKSVNQKQESPVVAMFVNGSDRNEQSLKGTFHRCFLPSFGSFGQAVLEEKIFRNRPIRNKNCLWRPCLLMNRDEMSNLYRGPPIDASYQVSVHLANALHDGSYLMQCVKLFAYVNNNIHDIKHILQDKQFHLQLKSEQKREKIQWQCYPFRWNRP